MRQRGLRNRPRLLEEGAPYLAEEGKELRGRWREKFAEGVPEGAGGGAVAGTDGAADLGAQSAGLFLEIGSGKGRFICDTALSRPVDLFIACEGGYHIYPRILQKAAKSDIRNLRVLPQYIYEPRDFFADGELDGIYLNFSDPWPKDKHGGRRLTYRAKLEAYRDIVRPGGFIAFKTDNDMLFDFTLGEMEAVGMVPERLTRDLHASEWAAENVLTEYEAKFSEQGKSINYVRVII